jgi:hypothetical protein
VPDIIRSRSRACDVCQGPKGQVADHNKSNLSRHRALGSNHFRDLLAQSRPTSQRQSSRRARSLSAARFAFAMGLFLDGRFEGICALSLLGFSYAAATGFSVYGPGACIAAPSSPHGDRVDSEHSEAARRLCRSVVLVPHCRPCAGRPSPILLHCALSGLFPERKSEFQSD